MAEKKTKLEDMKKKRPTNVEEVVEETDVINEVESEEVADQDTSEEEEAIIGGFNFGDSINRRATMVKEKIETIVEEVEDQELEDEIEGYEAEDIDLDDFGELLEDEEEDEIPTKSQPVKKKEAKAIKPKVVEKIYDEDEEVPDQDDLEDFDDEDGIDSDEDITEDEAKVIIEDYKLDIKEKLKVFEQKNAIESKTIQYNKKSISVNRVLDMMKNNSNVPYSHDFPLFSKGELVNFKCLSGAEIELLQGDESFSKFTNQRNIYNTLYNNILSEKPESFKEWAKSISIYDVANIYMGFYIASFKGSNHITYFCEKCNNVFLSEDIDITEMYEFENEEDEARFNAIVQTNALDSNCLYETKLFHISDYIAVEFREPSIYNSIIEISALDETFYQKYKNIIKTLIFIENIHFINEDGSYSPIAIKEYPTSITKEVKAKIATYGKILKALSSDQFQLIQSIIMEIEKNNIRLRYKRPECTCPKCQALIPVEYENPANLLFSRHQLPTIANS